MSVLSLTLAKLFLYLSFGVALIETAITLWSRIFAARRLPETGGTTVKAVDPGTITKLVEALKGLIQSLAAAPAWIAIFLAGLALLWSAGAGK